MQVLQNGDHIARSGADGGQAAHQLIQVRNLATQKRFLARVESKGRVTVGSAPRTEEKP